MHPFNGLFSRTTWVSQYQKGKTSLDLHEATDDGVLGCSSISWTICKQSAPRARQITTPTPRHSIFYRPGALPDAQQQCQSTEGTIFKDQDLKIIVKDSQSKCFTGRMLLLTTNQQWCRSTYSSQSIVTVTVLC